MPKTSKRTACQMLDSDQSRQSAAHGKLLGGLSNRHTSGLLRLDSERISAIRKSAAAAKLTRNGHSADVHRTDPQLLLRIGEGRLVTAVQNPLTSWSVDEGSDSENVTVKSSNDILRYKIES